MIKGDTIVSVRIEKGDRLDDIIKFFEEIKYKENIAGIELVSLNNWEIIFGDKKFENVFETKRGVK